MAAPSLDDLLALDLPTRLQLVEKLWESVVEDARHGTELPVSNADRRLLDERLKEDDEHPEAAIPWSEARVRLRNGA